MRSRRVLIWAAFLTVFSLFFTACNQAAKDDAGGKPEFKIGLMGDLSGSDALLVVGQNKAARVAVKQANEAGDLPVRLRLQPEDTVGNPDTAVALAQKLATDDKVLAIIGPGFSGESFSANPIIQEAGIPQITPSATNPGLAQRGWKAWWRALGNDNSQGGPAPDVALKYLQGKKVFIAHDNSAYGQGLATIVRDQIQKAAAGPLAGFEGIEPDREDYSALATKIASGRPDVFFWGGYAPEGGKIIKQARDRGFEGKFLGADGAKTDTFAKTAGQAGEEAYFLCPCADLTTSDDPVAKKFVEDYKEEIGEDVTVYSAEGYDSARIIIEAIRKAGVPGSDIKAHRQKVADNIRKTSGFKGTTKTYTFQPNGELVDEAVVIYLYRLKGDKFELVGKVDDVLKGGPAAESTAGGASPTGTASPTGIASPTGTASP